MRDNTQIITHSGIRCIADLTPKDDVLSWSTKDRKYQLAPTSGAYPKGKANLFRVITTQGEWYASEHHRVLCADGKYQQLANLYAGCELQSAYSSLPLTNQEFGRIWSPLDDLSYWRKAVDSAASCELLSSRYDQQLHHALNNALENAPLQAYALKSFQFYGNKGDSQEHVQEHIRQDQSHVRLPMIDSLILSLEIAVASVDRISKVYSAHTYENIRWKAQFLQTLKTRLQDVLYARFLPDFLRCSFLYSIGRALALEASYLEQALQYKTCSYPAGQKAPYMLGCHRKSQSIHSLCTFNNSASKAIIISIEKQRSKEWFWDMHVAGNNNYISADGAVHHNSGKSEAATMRLVHLITQDPGIDVSHFFPSYRLAKRRGFSGAMKYLKKLGIEFSLNKTDLTLYLPQFGSTIYLETYHDPDAIVSFEIAHAIVDELDTLKKDDAAVVWTKITERARQNCNHHVGNTVGAATTPNQGTSGFCFETWGHGERIGDGYHYIKAGTRSNKFLPEGYADQIAKNYDPIMAEAFLEGGWVSFTQNKVYHFFNREQHHTDRCIMSSDQVIHIGLDFNIGGCCAVAFVIENNDPIAVDEFVSYDTRDFVNNLTRYKDKHVIVYPDASGGANKTNASESDISIIERAGYQISAHPSNPAIRDRINAYNGLLAHDRLRVNTDMCPNLTNALETQGYDKKGNPEKWDKHPAIDDWVEGSGYFIAYRYPVRNSYTAPLRVRGGL